MGTPCKEKSSTVMLRKMGCIFGAVSAVLTLSRTVTAGVNSSRSNTGLSQEAVDRDFHGRIFSAQSGKCFAIISPPLWTRLTGKYSDRYDKL